MPPMSDHREQRITAVLLAAQAAGWKHSGGNLREQAATILDAAASAQDFGMLLMVRDLLREGQPALAESQLTTYLERYGK